MRFGALLWVMNFDFWPGKGMWANFMVTPYRSLRINILISYDLQPDKLFSTKRKVRVTAVEPMCHRDGTYTSPRWYVDFTAVTRDVVYVEQGKSLCRIMLMHTDTRASAWRGIVRMCSAALLMCRFVQKCRHYIAEALSIGPSRRHIGTSFP